jgi:hypothetical protein
VMTGAARTAGLLVGGVPVAQRNGQVGVTGFGHSFEVYRSWKLPAPPAPRCSHTTSSPAIVSSGASNGQPLPAVAPGLPRNASLSLESIGLVLDQ